MGAAFRAAPSFQNQQLKHITSMKSNTNIGNKICQNESVALYLYEYNGVAIFNFRKFNG